MQRNDQVSSRWNYPPTGTFKCNGDASWSKEKDRCGLGWILRDDRGRMRQFGKKTYPLLCSDVDVEAATLVYMGYVTCE